MRAARGEVIYGRTEAGILGKLFKIVFTVGVLISGYTLFESRDAMFDSILEQLDDSGFTHRFLSDLAENTKQTIETTENFAESVSQEGMEGLRTAIAYQNTHRTSTIHRSID